MLWLQTPPWGRWIAAGLIVAVAVWVELRPDPTVDHPFATEDIAAGEEVGGWNTESRRVPSGLLEEVLIPGVALIDIPAGDPVLAASVGDPEQQVPRGWWEVEVALPHGAGPGDRAQVVLLDSGEAVQAVVSAGVSEDPLGSGLGSVAVPGEQAAAVGAAAAAGRIAVLVATG